MEEAIIPSAGALPSTSRAPGSEDHDNTTASKSKAAKRSSKKADKQAIRRHQALEKEFVRAQKRARIENNQNRKLAPELPLGVSSSPLGVWSTGESSQSPAQGGTGESSSLSQSPSPRKAQGLPEATFTPATTGTQINPVPPIPSEDRLAALIAQAVDRALEARAQGNKLVVHKPKTGHQEDTEDLQSPSSPSGSSLSDDSYLDQPGTSQEVPMSDEEDSPPEAPSFNGLFNPSLFVTILRKAESTAHLGQGIPAEPAPPDAEAEPTFAEKVTTQHRIPCPVLFLNAIRKQWISPASLPLPSNTDKRLFNVAKELEGALEVPMVDEPLGPLISDTAISGDFSEALKAEDRKCESTYRRTHQATAWATRAATSASFFSRATLCWLRQLQGRVPAEDIRTHQELSKMVAATEYASDASLQAARFAARAIASNITGRRLLWLKHWQADAKSKWKLASAPYQGAKLFGDSLTPYLTENKDKRKVLKHILKKQDRRPGFFRRRQSFRAENRFNYSQPSQPFQARQDRQERQAERQNSRPRQAQGRQPFRGSSRPFRRSR